MLHRKIALGRQPQNHRRFLIGPRKASLLHALFAPYHHTTLHDQYHVGQPANRQLLGGMDDGPNASQWPTAICWWSHCERVGFFFYR